MFEHHDINSAEDLVEAIAGDVINNYLFEDRVIDAAIDAIESMTGQIIRTSINQRVSSTELAEIAKELGYTDLEDTRTLARKLIKPVMAKILERLQGQELHLGTSATKEITEDKSKTPQSKWVYLVE
jgi:hypothetical protein